VTQSYVERAPRAELAGMVRTVWIQRTGEAAYVQRHLPTGGVSGRPGRARRHHRGRRRLATVGAGARLAQVYAALGARGRTIPAGCGATVGIAGLTLGGGIGLLGRTYGLTCDHLAGARAVLADGRVVDCDRDREPELSWPCGAPAAVSSGWLPRWSSAPSRSR
jgi:FAD binding domain